MTLEDLFDIAHANSLNMMKIKENKEFSLFRERKEDLVNWEVLINVLLKKQMIQSRKKNVLNK